MIDKAFILAAGLGKRLRPYTDTMPKPMVPINNRPIIDYAVEDLANHGVNQIVVNTSYCAGVIHDHFVGDSKAEIILSHEEERLETGGGIKKALHYFGDEAFYIINGDALWQDPLESHKGALNQLASVWDASKMDILLLCMDCNDFEAKEVNGDYHIDKNSMATRSHDKTGTHMFTGIRICHPRIFDGSPDGYFSFLELMDKAEESGRLYAAEYKGIWHHISTAEDLERVDKIYKEASHAAL